MKALDESILIILLVLWLKIVHFLAFFRSLFGPRNMKVKGLNMLVIDCRSCEDGGVKALRML